MSSSLSLAERHARFLALLHRLDQCASPAEVETLLVAGLSELDGSAPELRALETVAEQKLVMLSNASEREHLLAASALIQSASDPMWVLDESLTIIGCNEAFIRVMTVAFHLPVQLGSAVSDLPPGIREQHEGLYQAVFETGEVKTEWRAPGSPRRFDVTLRAVDLSPEMRGIAVTATDSTQHHARAEALAAARDEAEQAGRAARDFLSQISHEVRTPLNAIVGLTELVRQGPLEDQQRGVLDRVQVNTRALLHLVGNVLDLSKSEAGQLDLQSHPANIAELFVDTVEFLRPRADAGGLELRVSVGEALPREVVVDPDRFRQIVTNIVDNAIRYTSAGSVVAELKFVREAAGEVIVEMAVKDTGVGIPERDHEMIFSRFFRSYRSQVGTGSGSGLGLAVTRSVVDAMEGEIRVRSAPGKGSTFRVRLPLALPVLESGRAKPRQLLRPLRILVADDSLDNLAVVESILRRGGHRMHATHDGRQAVSAMFEEGPFDVVLMDVDMPVMDGVRATVEIRSREGLLGRPRTPILAVTAHATESVRRRCAESGMDGFITKPIDGSRLLDRLDVHGRAARVMVVSSKPAQQKVMERAVRAMGADLVQAYTVAEAIPLVSQFRPHIAVVDRQISDGDGLELTDRLRVAGLDGPVVGCGEEDDAGDWSTVGVAEFLVTPVRGSALQEALTQSLAPGRAITWDPGRDIDPDLQDLVPLFLAERRKDLVLIADALSAQDAAVLRDIGHRIKGTGTSYGFPELTEAGAQLEEAARAEDFAACLPPIEVIRKTIA